MASVIILIGVPASGKSSLAEQMLRTASQQSSLNYGQAHLISPDRIREQLYGAAAIQGNWSEIWSEVQQEFANAARSQQSVIYDATNYQREYRKDVIALAKKHGFQPIIGIWLNVPLWICLSRNELRDQVVPEDVIIEMYRTITYTPPSLPEGFDRILIQDHKSDTTWID